MPQHGKYKAVDKFKLVNMPKSSFTGGGWEWQSGGYYLKHILKQVDTAHGGNRIFTDDEVAGCNVHVTINAKFHGTDDTLYKVSCPHVTFQWPADPDNPYHVYYEFESGGQQITYQYTDRSTEQKWRDAAHIIMRDDTGWGVNVSTGDD